VAPSRSNHRTFYRVKEGRLVVGGREAVWKKKRAICKKKLANKVNKGRGDIMLKRRFACDAGVARVRCRVTHLAASHASSGHPPPWPAAATLLLFLLSSSSSSVRRHQHFVALEGGCGGRLLVLVSLNHSLSSLSASKSGACVGSHSLS
jgi:hypothetical protein